MFEHAQAANEATVISISQAQPSPAKEK